MNKRGVADPSNPIFWGIVAAFWILMNAMVWRLEVTDLFTIKTKILITLVSAPVIWGICYLMGTEA